MIPAVILQWVLKYWKDLVIGACVVLVAAFIASWMMRGAKIERQKIELGTKDLRIEQLKEAKKNVVEKCSEKIDEINEVHKAAILAAEADAQRLHQDLQAVTSEADRLYRESAVTRAEVSRAIAQAEGCEGKRDELFKAMMELTHGS